MILQHVKHLADSFTSSIITPQQGRPLWSAFLTDEVEACTTSLQHSTICTSSNSKSKSEFPVDTVIRALPISKQQQSAAAKHRVAVLACGPVSLLREVSLHCSAACTKHVKYHFHKETFEL
jgi:hypothetical protein